MAPRAGMLFGRLASHRSSELRRSSPGTEPPALSFEVRVACSSLIAHPGLAAIPCRRPSRAWVTPSGNPPVSSSLPRSFWPSAVRSNRWRCTAHCSPAADNGTPSPIGLGPMAHDGQLRVTLAAPRPSPVCAPRARPASGSHCRLYGPPSGSRWSCGTRAFGTTRRRSAGGGCRAGPSCRPSPAWSCRQRTSAGAPGQASRQRRAFSTTRRSCARCRTYRGPVRTPRRPRRSRGRSRGWCRADAAAHRSSRPSRARPPAARSPPSAARSAQGGSPPDAGRVGQGAGLVGQRGLEHLQARRSLRRHLAEPGRMPPERSSIRAPSVLARCTTRGPGSRHYSRRRTAWSGARPPPRWLPHQPCRSAGKRFAGSLSLPPHTAV